MDGRHVASVMCIFSYLDAGGDEGLLGHDQTRDEEDELCGMLFWGVILESQAPE